MVLVTQPPETKNRVENTGEWISGVKQNKGFSIIESDHMSCRNKYTLYKYLLIVFRFIQEIEAL